MSVLRIPVRVMKTLNVPTVTVLTAVLVKKDLLEMELFVKVNTGKFFAAVPVRFLLFLAQQN